MEDRRAEERDRHLARSVAAWARHPEGRPPARKGSAKHNLPVVRARAYQEERNAGMQGPALDASLDLVDYAVARLR